VQFGLILDAYRSEQPCLWFKRLWDFYKVRTYVRIGANYMFTDARGEIQRTASEPSSLTWPSKTARPVARILRSSPRALIREPPAAAPPDQQDSFGRRPPWQSGGWHLSLSDCLARNRNFLALDNKTCKHSFG
jgi:hypothetical protein